MVIVVIASWLPQMAAKAAAVVLAVALGLAALEVAERAAQEKKSVLALGLAALEVAERAAQEEVRSLAVHPRAEQAAAKAEIAAKVQSTGIR